MKEENSMNPKIQTAKMIRIVAVAFEGKFDKAGEPYFEHCHRVAYNTPTDDEELRQIKLGHDLFEDTDITAQYLRDEGFSERVIDGIFAMTKHRGQSYEEYQIAVMRNDDTILTKMDDLNDNSDIRRMKNEDVREKDVARTIKYMKFYGMLKQVAKAKGLIK